MFTDIDAAIEEARYLKSQSGGRVNFYVLQVMECNGSVMRNYGRR